MKNIVSTAVYNDPVYLFDTFMDGIENTPFGDINSVTGDNLRSVLTHIYDVNLNMFDTHSFTIANFNQEIDTNPRTSLNGETFYIYEGSRRYIQKLTNVEPGTYKEGILCGFVDTAIRKRDFSELEKDRVMEIIDQLNIIALIISKRFDLFSFSDMTPYTDYIEHLAHFVAVAGYLLKKNCPIEYIHEFYHLNPKLFNQANLKRYCRVSTTDRYQYDLTYAIYENLKSNAEVNETTLNGTVKEFRKKMKEIFGDDSAEALTVSDEIASKIKVSGETAENLQGKIWKALEESENSNEKKDLKTSEEFRKKAAEIVNSDTDFREHRLEFGLMKEGVQEALEGLTAAYVFYNEYGKSPITIEMVAKSSDEIPKDLENTRAFCCTFIPTAQDIENILGHGFSMMKILL